MKKYLSIIALVLFTLLLFVYFVSKNTDNTPKTLSVSDNKVQEYVVDPSDMYVVKNGTSTIFKQELTANEKKWLIFMREEEKLARDVYTTLGNKWKVNIFSNIASSEQTHTDAVKALLIRYGIDDPSTNNAVGVYTSPVMQKLYNDLTKQGGNSLTEALVVGAIIEDLDINDLDKAILETSKPDILQVYKNLQKGSRNHLRAFIRNIEANGGTYIPKYISQELFNSIISSSQERGSI